MFFGGDTVQLASHIESNLVDRWIKEAIQSRQVDEQRRGVLSTLPHLWQPVRPETERRTAITQTVPTKASV